MSFSLIRSGLMSGKKQQSYSFASKADEDASRLRAWKRCVSQRAKKKLELQVLQNTLRDVQYSVNETVGRINKFSIRSADQSEGSTRSQVYSSMIISNLNPFPNNTMQKRGSGCGLVIEKTPYSIQRPRFVNPKFLMDTETVTETNEDPRVIVSDVDEQQFSYQMTTNQDEDTEFYADKKDNDFSKDSLIII